MYLRSAVKVKCWKHNGGRQVAARGFSRRFEGGRQRKVMGGQTLSGSAWISREAPGGDGNGTMAGAGSLTMDKDTVPMFERPVMRGTEGMAVFLSAVWIAGTFRPGTSK